VAVEKKREEGRRGLSRIEAAYKEEIINIAEYLKKINERLVCKYC
jgi:hypothetical protein